MATKELMNRIEEFEKEMERLTINLTEGRFGKLSFSQIWKQNEGVIFKLIELTNSIKESMFMLNPEKNRSIRETAESVLDPLNTFKMLYQKNVGLIDSKLAIENLDIAIKNGSVFVDKAKSIQINPSKTAQEILRLKEIYKSKEYLAAIGTPNKLLQEKLFNLTNSVKEMNLLFNDLGNIINTLKKQLNEIIEENKRSQFL
jgi:hypothetical protein